MHTEAEEIEFLNALKAVAYALIEWTHKCSDQVLEFSRTVENIEYKQNLEKLSGALLRVPENKPSSFYEAVLAIYICFSADPDSVGTLDRYLTPFYEEDMKKVFLFKAYYLRGGNAALGEGVVCILRSLTAGFTE